MSLKSFLRALRFAAVAIPLSGCALPPVLSIISITADVASYASTGKSVSDHGLSYVMQQDCAMLRVLDNGGPICVEEDEEATAVVSAESIVELGEPLASGIEAQGAGGGSLLDAAYLEDGVRPQSLAPNSDQLGSAGYLAGADSLANGTSLAKDVNG